MSTLLEIEKAFLKNAQVQTAINLTEVRSIQKTIVNGQKKKFEATLKLSGLVVNAFNWFKTDEAKALMNEEGIIWTNEEFGNKVFGYQKSFFYKLVKAGGLDVQVVDTFNSKCDDVERQGQDANRSLEGLLKYAKAVENGQTEGGQTEGGEGEGEGEGEETEPQVEVRTATIFTLTHKVEGGRNVSVRIDANGTATTNNSEDEIRQAIDFLFSTLQF